MRAGYFRVGAVLVVMMAAAVVLAMMVGYGSASAQVNTEAVSGTTITVNTEEDELNTDGDCSLREAIRAANTNAAVDGCEAGSETERDAIHFSLGKRAKIVLSSTLPSITDPAGLNINAQKAKITVSGNDAVGVFRVEAGAKFNLRNLTVADGNYFAGAGLLNDGGEVQVWNSTFSGNSATDSGGGIANVGTLEVRNTTFSKNSGDFGGGIFNQGGTLEVTNSTFSENSALSGGGIGNFSTLTVTNSTFSENSASSSGGIANPFGTTTLKNTIVAYSPLSGDCGGPIADGGYNIDTDGTCVDETVSTSKTTDPLLDPNGLADNGGPTQTIKLLPGSPAINTIPKATNGCGTEIKTDQRGVSRPQGKKCDIGAYEKKVKRR